MKIWKVDNYVVGDNGLVRNQNPDGTFGELYWRTPQMALAEILNIYEKQGATIKEVIMEKPGNYNIIYTVEDDSRSYGI